MPDRTPARRWRAPLCWIAAVAAACLALPIATASAAPPGLPGPPPGSGSGFPLPPAPGLAPAPVASLSSTTLPAARTGPGLLSGFAALTGNSVKVKIACSASGTGTLTVAGIGVKAAYRCSKGRATVPFTLTKSQAAGLPRGASVTASLTFSGKGIKERLSVSVGQTAPAPDYWTSTFGLGCTAFGAGAAQLVAPNFSVTPATTISVRPWLAWYTPATGWQWLGTRGPGKSTWYRWTGTPTGVAEWQHGGVISPWTWGPINVSPGHGTYVVAVFETIYWYGVPAYVWRYTRSQPGSVTTDCVYP